MPRCLWLMVCLLCKTETDIEKECDPPIEAMLVDFLF